MKMRYSQLDHIENNNEQSAQANDKFLFHLQKSLLMALAEQGCLNHLQYRFAYEMLCRKTRDRVLRQKNSGGGG